LKSDYHRGFLQQRRFGALDGLRALSILAVIWSHGPGQVTSWPLARHGRRGVDLFFAISGFLITSLLLRERQASGGISLRHFYARRVLRIFPLYYAVLLLYILLLGTAGGFAARLEFFPNVKYFLSYTANWFVPVAATFGFAWSLSTEEQFYCVWPWVEKYCQRAAPGFMTVLLSLTLGVSSGWIPTSGLPGAVMLSVAPAICFGALLTHALHHPRTYAIVRSGIGFPGAPLVAFAIGAGALYFHANRFLVALALCLIVAASVVREDHCMRRFLGGRALSRIGEVSYGMYLLHGLVYSLSEAAGARVGLARHGLPVFGLTVALTFALATLSFRHFESFFLKMKPAFESSRRVGLAAEASVSTSAGSG
jgi:peptidoglycan/LPS O-acetylase OafA/YrhL